MKAAFLRSLLVLGILANVAFLLINLRPDRPHLGLRRKGKVLLRADPPRAKWVKEHELDEFAAAHDLDLDVVTAQTFEDVLSVLQAEQAKPSGLMLAAIDDEIVEELRAGGALRPVQDVIEPDQLATALSEYLPLAVEQSRGKDGKVWFFPKRAEVTIAVFVRVAIEDCYLNWEADRAAINAALREANGVGLPNGYALEKTPELWDMYDLFVAAFYWAHHPAPWADPRHPGSEVTAPAPRVAFRTGANEDAVTDLVTSFYRHGLGDADVGRLDAPAVLDALQWQALFLKHHLLAKACEDPKGIDSDGVNALFKEGRLAWAPINQEDSLWLHGGARRDAEPGAPFARELDWGTLPAGVSLELKGGEPVRPGRSFSFESVHLWALPVHSPHPRLAVQLARFLTQRGLQQRETEAQGLLPIREDLRDEYPILFRLDWMQRILDASYHQLERGTGVVPASLAAQGYDDAYEKLYAALFFSGKPPGVTLEAVRAAAKEAARAP